MLLHGGGWPHILFNLLGVVLVGSTIERRLGWWRWLVIYFGAGIGAGLLQIAASPEAVDTGASGGVAGLIGALVWQQLADRTAHRIAAIYATFFTTYLAALLWLGPLVAAVVGSIVVAAFGTALRWLSPLRIAVLAAIVIGVGTIAMLVGWDVHGQAVLLGFLITLVVRIGGRSDLQRRADRSDHALERGS